jgi:hypothetical protein
MAFETIQNDDVKGIAQLTSITRLIHATKIYLVSLGKTVEQGYIDGDLGAGAGANIDDVLVSFVDGNAITSFTDGNLVTKG